MIFGVMEHSDTRQAVGKASNGGMIKKSSFLLRHSDRLREQCKKYSFILRRRLEVGLNVKNACSTLKVCLTALDIRVTKNLQGVPKNVI